MVISYLGGECFKITQGDLTLAFNPPAKQSALKAVRFGADVTFVSQQHPDFNGIESTVFGEREPFVVAGPGEYEVKGVAIRGFGAETEFGAKAGSQHLATIYSVVLEGMNLCFLGPISSGVLPQAAKQELDDIDVLFVPVGGEGVLDHAAAYKLAVQLEPKAIIPMHFDAASLRAFLKEAGVDAHEVQDKLTIKKKDLEGKEGEIIVLAA